MKKLFAFWRYDQFPFVLGAEVEDIDDDGWVKAKGYDGMKFKPIKIVPAEVGEQISSLLKKLEADERHARREHDETWRSRAAMILPEAVETSRKDR